MSCLSRYDALLSIRINPLGAWILGQADEYVPAAPTQTEVLRVLPNYDIVAAAGLPGADKLILELFAETVSDHV